MYARMDERRVKILVGLYLVVAFLCSLELFWRFSAPREIEEECREQPLRKEETEKTNDRFFQEDLLKKDLICVHLFSVS